MKKKVLSALLITTLVSGLLTGCGKEETKPVQDTSAEVENSNQSSETVQEFGGRGKADSFAQRWVPH